MTDKELFTLVKSAFYAFRSTSKEPLTKEEFSKFLVVLEDLLLELAKK